jgi:hypothetical protein
MTREEERLNKRWLEICAESKRRKDLLVSLGSWRNTKPEHAHIWFSAKEEAEHERILFRLIDLRDARQPFRTPVKNHFGCRVMK